MFLWDIETAKMRLEFSVYDRKLYSSYLPSTAITRTRWMPCASWKEVGKDHVHSVSVLDDPKRFKKDYSDDYVVVKALSDLMHKADVIIAHNGDNFDWKILTARLLYHNLPPIPRIKTVDTLKIARSQFRLEANDLRYLAWYLKLGDGKDQTPDWDLVSSGDEAEIRRCLKYNKQDVRVLEPVYKRLAPFAKIRLYNGDEQCPACGCEKYQSRGRDQTTHSIARGWRYACLNKDCGHWWTGKPPKTRTFREKT